MDRSTDTVINSQSVQQPCVLLGLFVDILAAAGQAIFALFVVLSRIELDGGNWFYYTGEYRRLSELPYSPSPLSSRGLVPFLAWLINMGGPRYAYFSIIITFTFLAVAALYLRRATGKIACAFIGTMLLATLPITEFGIYALGWPDQFCALMFLLTLLLPFVGIVLSIAGLLAHEFYIVFLLCSVVFIPRAWNWRFLNLVMPLGILWCSKAIFDFPPSGGVGLTPIINGFLAAPTEQIVAQPFALGFFSAMKIFTVLIPLALYSSLRSRSRDLWLILLSLALASGCLILAHDSTRIWGLALPALLITIRQLSRHPCLLASACIANASLPSYGISSAWQVHLERSFAWVDLAYRAVIQGVGW